VLLSQEKTLSRKLQELFLVWYLEQEIPKERILELYFNAIEFGPRLYGIGRATQHYFGKPPSQLTPLEAAFFSSILPSPKRRYIQYCHGAPLPVWDKYIHRILAKVHERGRITDEEYAAAQPQKLVFAKHEGGLNERQCLDWVKKMTARPEPEVPAEAEALEAAGDHDADGALPVGKLRRLFAKDAKRGAGSAKGGRRP
jgi:membrane peptidoglycan carboxypeptidase